MGDQGDGVVAFRSGHANDDVLNLLGVSSPVAGKGVLDLWFEAKVAKLLDHGIPHPCMVRAAGRMGHTGPN